MLDPVINGVLKSIASELAKYGLSYESLYNSDLDMLTQYTQSLNLRSLIKSSDLELLPSDLVKRLKGDSYRQLLYNYSPFRRSTARLNNINFSMVFDHNSEQGLAEFGKMESLGADANLTQFFRTLRDIPVEVADPVVRDMVLGEVDLTFKFLSYETDFIQSLQFVYVHALQRNHAVEIKLDFGEAGVHEFEFETEFKDIDTVGHIDFNNYGNLQEMTFSITIRGPFFSFYEYHTKYMKDIVLQLEFSGKPLDPVASNKTRDIPYSV